MRTFQCDTNFREQYNNNISYRLIKLLLFEEEESQTYAILPSSPYSLPTCHLSPGGFRYYLTFPTVGESKTLYLKPSIEGKFIKFYRF